MVKNKPQFNKERALSWSAISSFEYSPEEWYSKYILGNRARETREMAFGKVFAKSIEDGKCSVPIEFLNEIEYPFKVMFGKIPLIGYADNFCSITKRKIKEFKTGKKKWDQKRVDQHRQIDMYLFMNYLIHKVNPEEVEVDLIWFPTQDNSDFTISFVKPLIPQVFRTKRTMKQVLQFGAYINKVFLQMDAYAQNHY